MALLREKAMSLGAPDILVKLRGSQWLVHKSVLVACPLFARHFETNPEVPQITFSRDEDANLEWRVLKTTILYLYTSRFEAPHPDEYERSYAIYLYGLIDFADSELHLSGLVDLAVEHIANSHVYYAHYIIMGTDYEIPALLTNLYSHFQIRDPTLVQSIKNIIWNSCGEKIASDITVKRLEELGGEDGRWENDFIDDAQFAELVQDIEITRNKIFELSPALMARVLGGRVKKATALEEMRRSGRRGAMAVKSLSQTKRDEVDWLRRYL